jgi:hypothetical protein
MAMVVPKHETSISQGSLAELRLNGKRVGTVSIRGTSDSWSWGYFAPEPAFAEFAPLFGIWSLIMHADDETRRLSRAASDELRQAEVQIDSLRGELFWPDQQKITRAWQINIDDKLVEWKHE